MSDELPEGLKAKLLKKFMKDLVKTPKEKHYIVNPERIVWSKLVDDRARELMDKTRRLYPQVYPLVIRVFYSLLEKGYFREFDGYTTFRILRQLGIPVKPDLRIRFVKKGKEVSFKDYVED